MYIIVKKIDIPHKIYKLCIMNIHFTYNETCIFSNLNLFMILNETSFDVSSRTQIVYTYRIKKMI